MRLVPSGGGDIAVIVEKFQPRSLARVLSFLGCRGRKRDIFDDESLKSGFIVLTTVAMCFERAIAHVRATPGSISSIYTNVVVVLVISTIVAESSHPVRVLPG